jgi:hypothetical protein
LVATPVAILGSISEGPLQLSIWQNDRLPGSRMVPLSGLHDASWVSVALAKPMARCANVQLIFRFESPYAIKSGGSVWTYPAYFDGELRQGGRLIATRSVGLELNGFHFDVLP